MSKNRIIAGGDENFGKMVEGLLASPKIAKLLSEVSAKIQSSDQSGEISQNLSLDMDNFDMDKVQYMIQDSNFITSLNEVIKGKRKQVYKLFAEVCKAKGIAGEEKKKLYQMFLNKEGEVDVSKVVKMFGKVNKKIDKDLVNQIQIDPGKFLEKFLWGGLIIVILFALSIGVPHLKYIYQQNQEQTERAENDLSDITRLLNNPDQRMMKLYYEDMLEHYRENGNSLHQSGYRIIFAFSPSESDDEFPFVEFLHNGTKYKITKTKNGIFKLSFGVSKKTGGTFGYGAVYF